jgi:hypothetical protein
MGTGTMPRACSVGNDVRGSWTGIEVDMGAGVMGAGACALEAGVDGDVVVVGVEGTASALAVEMTGGTYCVMVELSGTE